MRLARIAGIATAALLLGVSTASAAIRAGDILVANPNLSSAAILKIDGSTGAVSVLAGDGVSGTNHLGSGAYDFVLTPEGRLLVVAFDSVTPTTGGVVSVDPATGAQTILSTAGNIVAPLGIAREPGGSIILADNSASPAPNGSLIRVDSRTGAQSVVSNNVISGPDLFDTPYGLAVERSGRILVADLDGGPGNQGQLLAVDPASGQQALLSNNVVSGPDLFSEPSGVLLDRMNLIVTDYSSPPTSGALLNVAPGGAQSLLASNDTSTADLFANPHRSSFDWDGNLLVADYDAEGNDGAVIKVTRATGQQSLVASNNTIPAPDLFEDPTAVLRVPPKCGGLYPTIVGTNGKDTLVGTRFQDVIVALNGKDKVKGRGGKDVLCGGKGPDTVKGGNGKDRLFGEAGVDKLVGGKGKDKLRGGKGRDDERQ